MVFLKSARSVEAIIKPGYHRCDRGLYLQVSINGTKSWIFRYKSPVTPDHGRWNFPYQALFQIFYDFECNRKVLRH